MTLTRWSISDRIACGAGKSQPTKPLGGSEMSVSTRKTETPVYDGSTGEHVDTHINYELGDEIDGVFVPFVTVRGAFVDHTIRLAKEQAAKEPTTDTESTEAQ